jgi:hypothetical protein
MAICQVARASVFRNSPADRQAHLHNEIARRYAWQAQEWRKRNDAKPDHARLLTLIRLRELERLFKRRYGRLLPDDDAGRDDLKIAAHHIALLRGEVRQHVICWARAWAPWMPQHEAEGLADEVEAEPHKFTADALAWRLRLSMAERTALKITTIGAFDVTKAEREAIQREKRRERDRARRAKQSAGRPRGRPRKNAHHAESTVAWCGFSPNDDDAAREPPEMGNAVAASKEKTINTSRAGRFSDFGEGPAAVPASPASRAAPARTKKSSEPPPAEVIETAAKLARDHHNGGLHYIGHREAKRLLARFWPRHVRDQSVMIARYGRIDPGMWQIGFRVVLDHEYEARHRYRARREKWKQDRQRMVVERSSNDRRALAATDTAERECGFICVSSIE